MRLPPIYLWQKAPALRLLLPFAAGILLQWYAQPQPYIILTTLAGIALLLFLFFIPALPVSI